MNQSKAATEINPLLSNQKQSKSKAHYILIFIVLVAGLGLLTELGKDSRPNYDHLKNELPTWDHKQIISDQYKTVADINGDSFRIERIGPLMQFADGSNFAHHTYQLNGYRYRDKVTFSNDGRIVGTEQKRLINY